MEIKKRTEISNMGVFEGFAKKLQNNPKELKAFEKATNEVYNSTGDIEIILTALKVLAEAKGNIAKLARDSNIERVSVYNLFKKGSNPTFKNVAAVSRNLGVNLNLSFAHK
jgi:probable addiction module antidote protein